MIGELVKSKNNSYDNSEAHDGREDKKWVNLYQ